MQVTFGPDFYESINRLPPEQREVALSIVKELVARVEAGDLSILDEAVELCSCCMQPIDNCIRNN